MTTWHQKEMTYDLTNFRTFDGYSQLYLVGTIRILATQQILL